MVGQRGRHLDFADAVADAVHTCEMRAQQLDDLLRTFMFVIPRVSHTRLSAHLLAPQHENLQKEDLALPCSSCSNL